jgi:hypothetical protein
MADDISIDLDIFSDSAPLFTKTGVYSVDTIESNLVPSVQVEYSRSGQHVATHVTIEGTACSDKGRSSYDGVTLVSFSSPDLSGTVVDRSSDIEDLIVAIGEFDPTKVLGDSKYISPAEMFRRTAVLVSTKENPDVYDHVSFRLTNLYASQDGSVEARGSKPMILPISELPRLQEVFRKILSGTSEIKEGKAKPFNKIKSGMTVSQFKALILKHNAKLNAKLAEQNQS